MLTQRELDVIDAIAARAIVMARPDKWALRDAKMDIIAAHNDIPLDLDRLLAADDMNFCHDVFGINRHLNRTTFKLENCFVPRNAREDGLNHGQRFRK
jgi:hypothetical protein